MEFVAEIGGNHNGDLEIAKQLIDVAFDAGCQFVKFQKRTLDKVYTQEELNKPKESPWGKTYGEYREHLEFGYHEFFEIDEYCKGRLRWFATPFDIESLHFLMQFDMRYIKVSSFHVGNTELLHAIRAYDVPVVMSVGMSDMPVIQKAVNVLGEQLVYILQCNSCYPSKSCELNLRVITTLKKLYPSKRIGFSNHFPGLTGMIGAAALGAEMVEFHATMDRSMYGTDHAASIEPQGVRTLIKHCKTMELALGNGEKFIYKSEEPLVKKYRG